jgi:hypothetical protein
VIRAFNEADKVADSQHLVSDVVRDLDAGELIFDRYHQFQTIEPVGPEIIGEVCFIRNTVSGYPQTIGNQVADLGGNAPARRYCSLRQGMDGHGKSPDSSDAPIESSNPSDSVAFGKISQGVAPAPQCRRNPKIPSAVAVNQLFNQEILRESNATVRSATSTRQL